MLAPVLEHAHRGLADLDGEAGENGRRDHVEKTHGSGEREPGELEKGLVGKRHGDIEDEPQDEPHNATLAETLGDGKCAGKVGGSFGRLCACDGGHFD